MNFSELVNRTSDLLGKKLRFQVQSPVRVSSVSSKTSFTGSLFLTASNLLCVKIGRQRSRGYSFHAVFSEANFLKAELVPEAKQPESGPEYKRKLFLKNVHPFAWNDLTQELRRGDDDSILHEKASIVNIERLIRKRSNSNAGANSVIAELKAAFEERRVFTWHSYASNSRGRDYTIEVQPLLDGSVKAYFSSEYAGCGNGDYYLLISPTKAIFYESD